MTNEEIIMQFLKPPPEGAYTDERLAMLLAHAEDGRLAYVSCCCLLGIPTADHALVGACWGAGSERHLQDARTRRNAKDIEDAFFNVALPKEDGETLDKSRRRKLIPLIKAEMLRREATISTQEPVSASALSTTVGRHG